MYFWERKNRIRDSDEKVRDAGFLVKKEREWLSGELLGEGLNGVMAFTVNG